MNSVAALSDQSLLAEIKLLRGTENQLVADVVLHLREIDRRGLYRDAGYSSLFTYCREALGYSEGASARRVRAARVLEKSPEVYELLREGKLTLCALSEVAPVINQSNKAEVLSRTEGISKREAAIVAVQFGAPVKAKKDCIRPRLVEVTPPVEWIAPVVEERVSFSFEAKKEMRELFEEAKELIGHCGMAEVFEKTLREFVEKRRGSKRRTPPVELKKSIRYIPKAVKVQVRERDNGQCVFVSDDERRCTERCGLEVDHVVPFSMGGTREVGNLRLLCRAHNQLYAERVFGKEFMQVKRVNA